MEYILHLLILVSIYLILAQAYNLTFGLGKLFNLAHISVYALGAYTTALLSTELQVGVLRCLCASMLIGGLFALLIGAISLKLSQDYFAIGTLAFSAIVNAFLVNWKSVTHGVLGITSIPRPQIGSIDFSRNAHFLEFSGTLALLTLIALYVVNRSSYGRALRAQAQSEIVLSSLGHDVRLTKVASFFIASCFAGLAGSIFAYYLNYIDPSSFGLSEMTFLLTIVIVGKPGSFWGNILATFFLVLLPEPLRFLDIPSSILGPMRQLLHAIILFAVVSINRATLFPQERTV